MLTNLEESTHWKIVIINIIIVILISILIELDETNCLTEVGLIILEERENCNLWLHWL